MTDAGAPSPEVKFGVRPDGPYTDARSTLAQVLVEGEQVSSLAIIPFTLRIGRATVRMDGVGGVETKEGERNRGYARRLLEAAVAHMRCGDAALTMLYGIPDFYPKFGYATAGPDHFITLKDLSPTAPLPAGFRLRPYAPADLAAIQRIYEQNTATAVGAAVRPPDDPVWRALTPKAEDTDAGGPARSVEACRIRCANCVGEVAEGRGDDKRGGRCDHGE